MAKDEYLQLAHVYAREKYHISGFYASDKLDGQRAVWDGGVSRGIPASEVPYANTVKDSRYDSPQISTGLFSRYGKAIQAPDWWLDQMPPYPVDGELWAGPGTFQQVSSIVRSSVNTKDSEWQDVRYCIFDTPPAETLYRARRVNPSPNVDFTIKKHSFAWWFEKWTAKGNNLRLGPATTFRTRLRWLQLNLPLKTHVILHEQIQLPFSTEEAFDRLDILLSSVLEDGGEGIMLKAGHDLWLPERVHTMLKVKPFVDAEGLVCGYTFGRETEKGSKLLGKMGALLVSWTNPQGKKGVFKVSGFTDAERILKSDTCNAEAYASLHPGEDAPPHIHNPQFPIGTQITFKYRELTDEGKPKEARYWRKA